MIEKLDRIPISGDYEEHFFELKEPWRGNTWNYVLFSTSNGDNWVGHFRTQEGSNFIVAELTSKNITCIISGGHGFIIDKDRKSKVKDIVQDMIIDLKADEDTKSFFVSTYWNITRVDNNLQEAEIELPIGPDGIFFEEIIDRKLFLKLDEIGADLKTNYDYYVDLDDMTIKKMH